MEFYAILDQIVHLLRQSGTRVLPGAAASVCPGRRAARRLQVRTPLRPASSSRGRRPRPGQEQGIRLAVRVGIHTGLVVVGEMGGSGRQEQLALGETPNVAARLQGLAAPDTVVISAATQRLVQGYFTCHDLGSQPLKGIVPPLQITPSLALV